MKNKKIVRASTNGNLSGVPVKQTITACNGDSFDELIIRTEKLRQSSHSLRAMSERMREIARATRERSRVCRQEHSGSYEMANAGAEAD